MNWSYRIARILEIDIRVHVTFVIIPTLVGLEWGREHGPVSFVFGVAIALALVAVFAADRYLGLASREDLSEALSVLLFERRRVQPADNEG